jgi:O-antigen ligase
MQSFLARHASWLMFFVSFVLILAMLCSKLLLSMAMFGLVLLGILSRIYGFGKALPSFMGRIDVFAPAVVVVFTIFTGLYSADTKFWWREVTLLAPVLGLPIVLYWLAPMSERQYKGLYAVLVVFCAIAAASTLYTYYSMPAYYEALLKQGQSIQPRLLGIKPIDHIRFSLLCALACVTGGYLWWHSFEQKWRWLWGFCALVLFASLHILAVRSGLLALYLCLAAVGLRQIISQKEYLKGGLVFFALLVLPFLAVKISPSLRGKYEYARWEMEQFFEKGSVAQNSDAGRWASIYVGVQIGNQNPLLGVGFGDVGHQAYYYYAKYFPNAQRQLLPHNEWAYRYAGGGVLGVLALCFSFFVPLFYKKRYTDFLFLMFNIVVFSSFLTESTLSTALGVALFSFFSAISINYLQKT